MKIDTKEKVDMLVSFISNFYPPTLKNNWDISQEARGYYTIKRIMHFAKECGAFDIVFHLNFKDKNQTNTSRYRTVIDNLADITIIGAESKGAELFNYFIKETQILSFINCEPKVVELLGSSSSNPMTHTRSLNGDEIEKYTSRLRKHNTSFTEQFNRAYEKIKQEETILIEKLALSENISKSSVLDDTAMFKGKI